MKKILIVLAGLLLLVGYGAYVSHLGYADGWAEARSDAGVPLLLAQADVAGPGIAAPAGVPVVHPDASVAPPAADHARCVDVDGAGPLPCVADPLDDPGTTWTVARFTWSRGGWPLAILLMFLVCAAYVKRMEPPDRDGDGHPDITGWRGHSWAIAVSLLILLGPLAAAMLRLEGASWAAVPYAGVAAVLALLKLENPVRGAALLKAVR